MKLPDLIAFGKGISSNLPISAVSGILLPELVRICGKYPAIFPAVNGRGFVAGIRVLDPAIGQPDAQTALWINTACFQKGLLMFAPVGPNAEYVKIAPPLCIAEDGLREGIAVFAEAVDEVLTSR